MELRTNDGVVYADRIVTWRGPRRTHPSGRVCAAPGCKTLLSVYNGSSRCCLHALVGEAGSGHRVHRSGTVRGTQRAA
jgi:hypothetical protein